MQHTSGLIQTGFGYNTNRGEVKMSDLYSNLDAPGSVKEAILDMHRRVQLVEIAQKNNEILTQRIIQNTEELLVIVRTARGLVGFIKALNIFAKWITVIGIAILTVMSLFAYAKSGKIPSFSPE